MTNAIEATGLVKKYGEVVALDGLDLAVAKGPSWPCSAPTGPARRPPCASCRPCWCRRGAGDGGRSRRGPDAKALRRVIGLSGQNAAVDEHLTGFENLDMVGRLYHLGRRQSRSAPASCWRSST